MTRDPTWTLPQPPADPRARAVSFGVAVLLHALVILLVVSFKSPPEARPGPPGWALSLTQPDEAGGGGGGATVTMQLPAPPAETSVPTPEVPTPQVVVPDVSVPEITIPQTTIALLPPPDSLPKAGGAAPVAGAGAGSGGRSGSGTGTGGGSGSGNGAGTGSGRGVGSGGDGVRPPMPLSVIIPPAATSSVRGKNASVRLQVDSAGVVRGADVIVSSGDHGYDEKLRKLALGWRFRPARDAGNRPIAYPFEVSFRF